MLENLTKEMFEPLIGQQFTMASPERTLQFELVDVEELPAGRRRGRRASSEPPMRQPFSLFFVGAALLPQAMYPLQHDAFGSEPLLIFIVPVGEVAGGRYEYEAVFT